MSDREIITVAVNPTELQGAAIRLAMLMKHYRAPIDWTEAKLDEARRTLFRWYRVSVPTEDAPPDNLIAALCDDLNTPKAIAVIHRYAKSKNGKAVYASLRMLGLLPGSSQTTPTIGSS
jgi:cysteinyl-tRNA synthetase